MKTELKNAIIKHIQDNADEFQLVNTTVEHFRVYIYDAQGKFLIGGEEVWNFIRDFIKIYTL